MKNILVLLLLVVLNILDGCKNNEFLTLSDWGETDYVIYLGNQESEVVKFAASELADYLNKISNASFEIITDSSSIKKRIIIGSNNPFVRSNKKNLELDSIKADGFRIKEIGEDIYITGAIDRGVLYGVYHLLDNYFGVRWLSPEFEIVPSKNNLSLSLPLNDLQNPRFIYREIFGDTHDGLYRQHNRLNGNRFHRSELQYDKGIDTWSGYVPGGQPPKHGGHNFYDVVKSETCHHGGQLLAMDDTCRFKAANYFTDLITDYGTGYWYGFSQRDNGWEPDSASQSFADAHGGALSAPIIDMVIGVANRVRKKFRDAKFATFAYQFSFNPPTGLEVPDYLLVEPAVIHANFGKPYIDKSNTEIRIALQGWNKIAKNLGVWDYITNFQNYLQPLPNIYPMCQNIQFLSDLDAIKGYFGQGAYNTEGAELSDLRVWIASRLLWNPQQDYKALINEFVEGYYGPAAPYIKKYIEILHQAFANSNDRLSSKQRITSDYLNIIFIMKADSLLRKADEVAGKNYAKQVHEARLGIDMTILLREQSYKFEAFQKGIKWLEDSSRMNRFMEYSKEAGVTNYNEDSSINELYAAMNIERKNPVNPAIISLDDEWIDFQDLDFSICCGADIVQDNKASDNGAVKYSGQEWAIQVKLDMLPSEGAWELYANIRCDVKPGSKVQSKAFNMGIYPGGKRTPLVSDVNDGKYHLLKFPGMPVSYQTGRVLWFTVDESVTNIYVDRIIARRINQ
jgi:hypothetical protein